MPAGRALRILIAEDNAVNQLVLSEQIRTMGHTSLIVSNGREALEAVERSVWDAIFLDCQMPVMDGYETVAAIRGREAAGAQRTWTVAITAGTLADERETCIRSGMDDFLSKPFHFRELAQVVARIPPQPENPEPPVSDSKLAHLAKSTAPSGGNLLDRMIHLFTESGPEILDEMDQALAAGDIAGAGRAAHKLGGGCNYFGATALRTLCTEAERLGHADDAGIRAIGPRIRREYERVEAALQRSRHAG
jgi:CheY-like chemotaxis protein/HPt (histidine-containing phosphotransfer) domain-containing protein